MPTEATTNREELMSYFKLMYTMRRMEITCDTEYKVGACAAAVFVVFGPNERASRAFVRNASFSLCDTGPICA